MSRTKRQPIHVTDEHDVSVLESFVPDEAVPSNGDGSLDQSKPLPNLSNAVRKLETDRELKGLVWFDEFLQRIMTGNPPREWTDADDLNLTLYMQRKAGIPTIGVEMVTKAALTIAFRNVKNCAKDWLNSLEWDRVPRIDHCLEDHFGAAANPYTRAASKNFLLSMVARIIRPGCQADHMIVLEGPQGSGKSSALRVIGGDWFCEQHESVTGRGFFEVLQGKALVEISEMDAFSRAEVARVKQVITNRSDRFREPYGRHAKDHPRQCIFAGTTNKDDWSRDDTGARRFWPIACRGEIDVDAIATYRTQFFAEAVHRFKTGETWWEMPDEETRTEQANRYVAPAWVEPIQRYVEQERLCTEWIRRAESLTEVSIAEVLEHGLDVPRAQWTKANEMRVAEALRFMGWQKRDVRREGRIVKRWVCVATKGGDSE